MIRFFKRLIVKSDIRLLCYRLAEDDAYMQNREAMLQATHRMLAEKRWELELLNGKHASHSGLGAWPKERT